MAQPIRKRSTGLIPVFPPGTAIPKIIHQVYTNPQMPPLLEANVRSLRELNPRWEHRLYGEAAMEHFIRSAYGDTVLGYYHRIKREYLVARIDLFKYLLMYRQGGVYLDVKSSTAMPLDDVLRAEDVFLLSNWPTGRAQYEGWGQHRRLKRVGGREFQQWHIIAAPGHPFLHAVVEQLLDNIGRYNPVLHNTGKDGVLRLTGPIAYAHAITPLLTSYPHRRVNSHEDLGLVYSVYEKTGGSHKAMFSVYYSELDEPITSLTRSKRLLWATIGPLRKRIINPAITALRRARKRLRRR